MEKEGKENAFKIKRLTAAGLSPSAVQPGNESRKQLRFRLVMMSAILGTLFTLGGSAKLCCCFCCFACRLWSPGGTSSVPTPRTFPRLHNDRELGTNLRSLSPGLASPRSRVKHRFLHTHFLTKGEAAAEPERGQPQKKESPGTLPGTLARPPPRHRGAQSREGPSAALPAAPSAQSPDHPPPGPRTLQSTATASGGMMSASSPHLESSFLASFWARAELNVTFTMARPGAPSEGDGELEARAEGSWLRLQPPRPGAARRRRRGGERRRGSRDGYCSSAPAASQLPGEGGDGSRPRGRGRSRADGRGGVGGGREGRGRAPRQTLPPP